MNECAERIVKVGFKKNPKKIFDEVDIITASMIRGGWFLKKSLIEDGLGNIHLFFERELSKNHNED
jgi:hypothetical protein